MMRRVLIPLFAGASVMAFAGVSSAQDYTQTQPYYSQYSPGYPAAERPVRGAGVAPANALELQLGFGYNQPFGQISEGTPSIHRTADAGGALEGGIGYRFLPSTMIGVYGGGGRYGRGDATIPGSDVWSATAGVHANWHFLPYRNIDPWIGLGIGWRGLWIGNNGDTDSLHGLDILRGQVGVDFRAAPMVSIAPVIGATMSMFLSRNPPGSAGFGNISDPRLNTFIFAGLQGRFDVPLGEDSVRTVAKR